MRVAAAVTGVLAVVLGLGVGILLFIVGVTDIVDAVQANPVDGGLLAWGIVLVLFLAELAGWLVFAILGVVAAALADF